MPQATGKPKVRTMTCPGRTKRKLKTPGGRPAVVCDGIVTSWQWDQDGVQMVPAIECSRVTVVRFPVQYYQHFGYSPEAMALRRESIEELGWSSQSFDLPRPPVKVAECSLLKDALGATNTALGGRSKYVKRMYPSMVAICTDYRYRNDFCVLYFNHAAYEFYHLLFLLGRDAVPFENIPNPKIGTFNQLLRWTISFEHNKRKQYRAKGFTWQPVSIEGV